MDHDERGAEYQRQIEDYKQQFQEYEKNLCDWHLKVDRHNETYRLGILDAYARRGSAPDQEALDDLRHMRWQAFDAPAPPETLASTHHQRSPVPPPLPLRLRWRIMKERLKHREDFADW